MKLISLIQALFFTSLFFACQQVPEKTQTTEEESYAPNAVEIIKEEGNNVLYKDAQLEKLGSGFEWAEGPVWIPSRKMLLFSDVPTNTIYQWTEAEGVKPFLSPSGFTGDNTDSPEPGSNGLWYSDEGDLILCQHGDRRVARYTGSWDDPKAEFETLTDKYDGKRFNSPNDLVMRSDGMVFFTDPPYGLRGQDQNPTKEIPFCGVYSRDADGQVTLVTSEMSRPNGIGLSPDESTLYVANSDGSKPIWMAFDINEKGEKVSGKLLYDATGKFPGARGLPDGLKVHPSGLIFATGPGGVLIFNPEGELIAKVNIPQATANCGFDDSFQYLYTTSDSLLYRIKLKTQAF